MAWTALKAGKIVEAQAAMQEALRLETRDARLFYHAGMIAEVAGPGSCAGVSYPRLTLSRNSIHYKRHLPEKRCTGRNDLETGDASAVRDG